MNENLETLIPKNKSDIEAAEKLVAMGYPKIAPVLPQLMEWVQDYNWPVAKVIAPFLASIGEPLIPEIKKVLTSNDDMWKYWCLHVIVDEMKAEYLRMLAPELERLATNPSQDEIDSEVDEIAKTILSKFE